MRSPTIRTVRQREVGDLRVIINGHSLSLIFLLFKPNKELNENVVGMSTPASLTSLLVAHTSAVHPGVRAASDALVSWVRAVLTASV